MTSEEVRAAEGEYVLHTYDRPPFVLERGEGVYLYDKEGKRYLDMVSGISVNALGDRCCRYFMREAPDRGPSRNRPQSTGSSSRGHRGVSTQ